MTYKISSDLAPVLTFLTSSNMVLSSLVSAPVE